MVASTFVATLMPFGMVPTIMAAMMAAPMIARAMVVIMPPVVAVVPVSMIPVISMMPVVPAVMAAGVATRIAAGVRSMAAGRAAAGRVAGGARCAAGAGSVAGRCSSFTGRSLGRVKIGAAGIGGTEPVIRVIRHKAVPEQVAETALRVARRIKRHDALGNEVSDWGIVGLLAGLLRKSGQGEQGGKCCRCEHDFHLSVSPVANLMLDDAKIIRRLGVACI